MTTPAIVVLTDFFAVSNRALSYAAGLAVPLQSHLVLLHVCHDELLSPDEYHHRPSQRQTRQALNALADDQPVPTQVEVSEEFLPKAVAEAVQHHQPRLLVLGRPGTATAPDEVVTGAAMDLLRYVPYPLLIVPTVGWGAFPPRRLALAVDGEPFSLPENQHLVPDLLDALHASLTILHVADDKAAGTAAAERALHTVRRSGLVPEDSPARLVYHADAAAGILQGAAEAEADLLVVVARRHSLLSSLFHRSVTAQLIEQSPVPVLLLPSLD